MSMCFFWCCSMWSCAASLCRVSQWFVLVSQYWCFDVFIYPQVASSPWSPNNTVLKFPGIMTDLVLADCYLPESPVTPGYFHEIDEGTPAGLMISVSNDGEHKSNKNLTFISYDSACMSCNVSSGCTLKANKQRLEVRDCFDTFDFLFC